MTRIKFVRSLSQNQFTFILSKGYLAEGSNYQKCGYNLITQHQKSLINNRMQVYSYGISSTSPTYFRHSSWVMFRLSLGQICSASNEGSVGHTLISDSLHAAIR